MRLNFGWSVELGLNLALETQRKGNSASKASRSSSVNRLMFLGLLRKQQF